MYFIVFATKDLWSTAIRAGSRMHGHGRIVLAIVSFGALAGCTSNSLNDWLLNQNSGGGLTTASVDQSTSAPTATSTIIPGLPNGYQCPFVPNGFDPVASIYRVDKSGTYFRVADRNNDKHILSNVKNNVNNNNDRSI